MSKIMKLRDVQEHYGIGRDKAYALMKSKGFPSILIGRTYVVFEESLMRWEKEHEGRRVIL